MTDDPPDFPVGITRGALRLSPRRGARLALPAALLLLGSLLPVRAAEIAGAADNRPIDITADSGIEWQKAAQVYVARGNAVATRGATQVHADTLTAHYRPAKGAEGGNEVYRLDADGHVVIGNGADSVTGDHAAYDVGQEIAIVTGKTLRLTTPTDMVTAHDSFEWYDGQQTAVARGDAVAIRGDRRIRADVLTAHMIKANPPSAPRPAAPGPAAATSDGPTATEDSKISRIDAQGHIVVSTPTDIARGDYGVYDAIKGIVTLIDNVTITRGQNVIRGPYAVVDLKTNVSRMMSVAAASGKAAPRVEGIFVRQDTSVHPSAPTASRTAAPAAGTGP